MTPDDAEWEPADKDLERGECWNRGGTFSDLTKNWNPALPGSHCLPVRLPQCVDPLKTGRCEEVQNLPRQFGCGGTRGRLSCDDQRKSIFQPLSGGDHHPALIAVPPE